MNNEESKEAGDAESGKLLLPIEEIEFYSSMPKEKFEDFSIKSLFLEIFALAFPAFCGCILDGIGDIFYIHFAGSLNDPIFMASVGFGTFWFNVTNLSVLIGICSALGTLCSQAIGKKDYYLCGVYHLRARVIVLLFNIPLLWFL